MREINWPRLIVFFASIAFTFLILGSLVYVYLESQLPNVSELKNVQLQVPLQVYTRDGKLIGDFGPVQRAPISYNQIPPLFIKALLATEDQRYFEHSGVDIFGLMRAAVNLVLTGHKSQGGSTITMQVARNFYLTRQKTFTRKFEEILLALKINRELGKEKILELYLNKIYFGQQAYGIGAAAQVYYGKPLNELTLPELATLAGLPQAPSALNPIMHPGAAKIRRDHVLERMYELEYIDKKTYEQAIQAPMTARFHSHGSTIWAPYVGEMVSQMVQQTFGDKAFTSNYRVYTTISSNQQLAANQAVRDGLIAYDQRHGYRGPYAHLVLKKENAKKLTEYLKAIPETNGLRPGVVIDIVKNSAKVLLANEQMIQIPWSGISWTRAKNAEAILHAGDVIWVNQLPNNSYQLAQIPEIQSALVALNPSNGAITALVGGFDYRLSSYNRATQAERQPGSGFKPFIYSAALDKGYTLASEFNDAPIVFPDPNKPGGLWRPENDTREFYGPTRLSVALAASRNIVSIRLLQAIGVPYAIDYVTRFGFDKQQLPQNLTLILGTADVTPLQLVTGYATFANGGYRVSPFLIDHIVNSTGETIYQYQPPTPQRILSPETDFLMVSAMKGVIDDADGTGHAAIALGRTDLAGKTGTSNGAGNSEIDAWFNGFNSDIVTTVWVGFDQPKPIHEYGSQAALPIWMQFMGQALAGKPENSVPQPPDVVSVKIDPATGLLAWPNQPNAIFEYFTENTVPQQVAPVNAGPASSGTSGENGEPIF